MSLSSSYPLPALQPDTKLSFQPYPIASRQSLHSTLLSTSIRGAAPPSTATTSHAGSVQRAAPASWSSTRSPQAGPGPTSESIKSERKARQRAERRAVAGRRPAGVGLGPDADELSDEEEALEQERVGCIMGTMNRAERRPGLTCSDTASSCPLGGDRPRWRWIRPR